MAAYNFPNSPSDGDTVTSNGITYTYSSSKTRWDAAAPSGSSTTVYATIDDLPLSGASTGDQAYVSGNNRLYIWNGSGWYNIALINTTPSISGVSSSYGLAVDGTATTVTITATDPEGIPITYSIASDTSGNVATVTQGTGSNTNVFTITPSTNTANAGTFSLTFRASDGVNIATVVSEFTLAFGTIQNSQFTTALITSVGANNAVNNSFDDASTNNHTITANGNVTQNTFSPYRHGGYSTYFDGSGDQIETPTDASLTVGTGQFTIECWFQVHQDTQQTIFSLLNGTSNVVNVFYWPTDNNIGVVAPSLSQYGSTNSNTVDLHKWHHLSLVRNATTMFLYVDGSLMWNTSPTANITNINSNRVRIAANQYGNNLLGYVSDLRFVVGTAITPASGGPEDRLAAVTNTELLTCHLPYISDGSTNNHSLTVSGNTKTEPFTPYDHDAYEPASHGGSMYFDGSGDSLSIADNAAFNFGSGDSTIEMWVYPLGTGTFNLMTRGSSGYSGFILSSTGFLESTNGSSWAVNITFSTAITANAWQHVAVVRNGSTITVYRNGISVGTASISGSVTSGAQSLIIGQRAGQADFSGYMSGVRIVKGTAVYTSAFTPPTAPLTAITNTSLLLNGTDAGIIDKSQSVKTITLNGDVKSSESEYKFLTSSIYFDGTGDYFDTDFPALGTGDFTIEFWINPSTINSAFKALIDTRFSNTNNPLIWIKDTNVIYFYAGADRIVGTTTLSADTWYHVALVRNSGTSTLYLDGASEGTYADSLNYTEGTLRFGQRYSSTAYNYHGYLSDLRITKGLARYTASDETANIPSAALQG